MSRDRDDMVQGGLESDLGALLAGAEPEGWAPDEVRPQDRRRTRRWDLSDRMVRVVVEHEGQRGRGRVRNISSSGGLHVDSAIQPPFRTDLEITLANPAGRALVLEGRVVRHPDEGSFALHCRTDAESRAFLAAWIDAVRAGAPVPDILIRPPRAEPDGELSRAWNRAVERWPDASAHDAFIERCLAAGRLDFALARYREAQAERASDPIPTARLDQIGTLIGFCALVETERSERRPFSIPGPFKIILLAIAGVGALLVALTLLR